MLLKDFITKDIPVLKKSDSAAYALALMDDWKVRQLPLLEGNIYQTLISEKDLLTISDSKEEIGDPVLFAPAIEENGNIYTALALMGRYGLCVLPVVSNEGVYLGVITRDKLVDAMAELSGAHVSGSVITLELLPQDYVLSDMARIVESNNAHIINLLSTTDPNTGRMLITIKIDLDDASPVIRSFERFNYTILYHFMEQGMVDDILQKRMNELLYYMNM
ncbi:putative transcriptional regulator [Parabacteroides sp. PFB2-10]|uniref:CBS domain-containing protein n=1 Tax=Parabacteroides sp. PFB2-10 TaxID=1742405 RepID=UPI00247EA9CD|nr:putative transcriptional regulator [Parabacteroides sp. PFB2-10]